MESLEAYLKQDIRDRIGDLQSQYNLSESMFLGCVLEGVVRTMDIKTFLEAYRKEAELCLLLKLYNKYFDDASFRELEFFIREESETTEDAFANTLIRLLNE